MPKSLWTKVVEIGRVYLEIYKFSQEKDLWFAQAADDDFYKIKPRGLAFPIDKTFYVNLLKQTEKSRDIWFEHRSGDPFVLRPWIGLEVLGYDIEARALAQKKRRKRARIVGPGIDNPVVIRVPHR